MRYESATAGEFQGRSEPAQAALAGAQPMLARPAPTEPVFAEPLGLLAVQLAAKARAAGGRGVIHVAGGERRAERLGAAVRALWVEGLQVVVLPPWDCLPYDRGSPSRTAMGRRVVALRRLAARRHDGPRLLITVPEGLI